MNVTVCDICGATISETNLRYALDKRYFVFDERDSRFKIKKTYALARIEHSKTEKLDICEDCIKMIEKERAKQNESRG